MQGKIIKAIAGFYYVFTGGSGIYACKAKGIFRKEGLKPLVGDDVEMEVTHEGDKEGNIIRILPRRNTLIRPAVANIDQAVIIFAAARPEPNFYLLDRFLVAMQQESIPCVICFNKEDYLEEDKRAELEEVYNPAGYRILFTSAKTGEGVDALRDILEGKTSTVAGPSGVGKSSLINLLAPDAEMETGEISRKIERGKNTTRHTELLKVDEKTFIMDTPGFTSFYLQNMEKEDLRNYFPEFMPYQDKCRFRMCSHLTEPDCAVQEAVAAGEISPRRYEHYKMMYEELKKMKKY